jgi:hypothetical protein
MSGRRRGDTGVGSLAGGCDRPRPSDHPFTCLLPGVPDGLYLEFRLVDLRTNTTVAREQRCWQPNPADPAAPVPPPPSPEEVFDRAGIDAPEINVLPEVGLVALETYLWFDHDTQATAAVDLNGWHAEVEATLVGYRWDMEEGTVTGSVRGSADQPSATYSYRWACFCTITATAIWSAVYTLTHPLLSAPVVVDLGTHEFSTTEPYQVNQGETIVVD